MHCDTKPQKHKHAKQCSLSRKARRYQRISRNPNSQKYKQYNGQKKKKPKSDKQWYGQQNT
jgi:predicted acetyltransferase